MKDESDGLLLTLVFMAVMAIFMTSLTTIAITSKFHSQCTMLERVIIKGEAFECKRIQLSEGTSK